MDVTFIAWAGLVAGLVVLLLLDLLVLHRGTHEVSVGNAAWSSAGFVAVAIAFGIVLSAVESHHVGAQFFAGYLLELSLVIVSVISVAIAASLLRPRHSTAPRRVSESPGPNPPAGGSWHLAVMRRRVGRALACSGARPSRPELDAEPGDAHAVHLLDGQPD